MTMASPSMMMMQQQPQQQYYGSPMPPMMGGGGGPNGYMDQEEEFDRELLLDPMWEKQQRKTFTAWCNSHLRKAGTNITNIDEDFRNGLKLMLLLEILSGEQLPKPDKGRMRFHQIANVNKALDFIASKGVNLVSIGAEEIVDGNAKMTLGMIWTIILRFAIEDIAVENQTAKDALLLWCQRKTAPYKNVNVQDFHRSWKDGLAFCALIHRHRPDLLDYSKLSKSNPYENLNLAFDIAEKYLDIPRMLDAEDMVDMPKPDERAVMAYVSCFYHAFKHLNQSEAAANRIAKALRGRQDFSGLEKEDATGTPLTSTFSRAGGRTYKQLLDWINRTRPWLQAHTYDGTLPGLKGKLNEYVQYRTQPAGKPPRLDQKCALEATYNTLQTKRKLNDKPAYVPQEGRRVQDVQNAWKGLEDNEKGYEQWLINELNRLEKLDPLAEKFRRKCDIHEQWSRGKAEMLSRDDYKNCTLQELRALKRKMEAFEGELVAQQERVEQIAAIAGELHKLGYHDSPKINARCKQVCDQWDNIGGLTQQRKRGIMEAEKVLENADRLHQEFARRAAPFNNWLDGAREDLSDMILVHSVEELDNLGAAHHQFKSTLGEADNEHAAILNIWQQIQQLSQQHNLPSVLNNPYTNIVPQEVMTKWTEVKQLVPQRDQNLGAERQRQIHLEQLRKQFADKANQIGPWIEQNLDRVSKVGTAVHKSLEEAIRQLHVMRAAVEEFKPHMAELEQLHKACCDAMIFRQPYARYSIDTLRVGWDQLVVLVHRVINEVENQILTRDSKGITGDQLSDYRRSFNLFDKKRTGRLSADEFRALLASLGFQVDGPRGNENFGKILSQVDPMQSGIVAFETFLNYVTKTNAGSANVDELIDNFRILAEDKPYITADILRRELPGDQAENCVSSMRPYTGPNAVPGALDYVTFCRSLFG